MLSFIGFSLFFNATYQYFSVMGKEHIFHKPWGIFLMFVIPLIYPIPTIILYIPNIDYEALKSNVLEEAPELYEFFIAASCSGSVINRKAVIYIISSFVNMGLFYVVGIFYLVKIFKKLNELKNSMSSSTLKLKKQFLWSIATQYTLPFAVIVIPISVLILSIIFNKGDIEGN